MKNQLIQPKDKKKVVTLFMILVFSLLIAMASYINNYFLKLWFQVILLIAQIVIVNTILSDYFGD